MTSKQSDIRIRTIKIKSGIVRRLAKEVVAYQKESEREQQRLDKMKSDGLEELRIQLQEKVIQESRMMIPDCRKRLVAAWEELKVLLDGEDDLAEDEDYIAAKSILDEAQPHLT